MKIDIDPLSSEWEPTRTIRRLPLGGHEFVDTTAARRISDFDPVGRLIVTKMRTGEHLMDFAYVLAAELASYEAAELASHESRRRCRTVIVDVARPSPVAARASVWRKRRAGITGASFTVRDAPLHGRLGRDTQEHSLKLDQNH